MCVLNFVDQCNVLFLHALSVAVGICTSLSQCDTD